MLAVVAGSAAACRPLLLARRRRRAATDARSVLSPRALRELDARLRAAAADEQRRLERELAGYVTGRRVGYVVAITDLVGGLALDLSDGRRLSLGGVAHRNRLVLTARAEADLLRPTVVERAGPTYRMLLRGYGGDELELYAQRVALVAPTT